MVDAPGQDVQDPAGRACRSPSDRPEFQQWRWSTRARVTSTRRSR